jgi:hypothetical protein
MNTVSFVTKVKKTDVFPGNTLKHPVTLNTAKDQELEADGRDSIMTQFLFDEFAASQTSFVPENLTNGI